MSKLRIVPWLKFGDYEAFKKLSPSDPNLPSTYEEWLETTNDQISAFIKSGIPIEKVAINLEEFKKYCKACGINPDNVARDAFAVKLHYPQQ